MRPRRTPRKFTGPGGGPAVKLYEDQFLNPNIPLGLDDEYVYFLLAGGPTGDVVRMAR